MTENDLHTIVVTAVRTHAPGQPVILDCPECVCAWINEIHALFCADSDGVITVMGREYKVICITGEGKERVVLMPPEAVAQVKAQGIMVTQPISRRTKEDLRAWWIQGLAERGIKLQTPDYSKLNNYPMHTWEGEDEI